MKSKKLYYDYIKSDKTLNRTKLEARNACDYEEMRDGFLTFYFIDDKDAIRFAPKDQDIFLVSNYGDSWVVSDSRSLEIKKNISLGEAIEWLDDKCELNEMQPGDWRHPEYWSGCEEAPLLFTMEEWLKIIQE